jgi:phage terminase large subunit
MQITRRSTGQKILFRGLDDGLKITSISVDKGVLCWVWIDEAYEITNEDDFNKLDLSIRGEVPEGYFKQITLTFNPWSATSWLKARFFDTPDNDTFTKTTTWECNEWLDEADRNIFLKMQKNNPRRYRIEGEGEWGIADGLIYTNVVFEDFNIDEIRSIKGIKSAFNLDFGFTDPNAFVCEMVDNAAMRIYIFDEWYRTGVTNKIIAQAIKDMGYGGQTIVCDSAEPKSIAELQEEGIKAEPSRKGKDSVNHGIQLIQNYQIVVHPGRCPEFSKEISNYCWSKDKDGKPTDKPDHEFSHGMDSMRYGVSKILLPDAFSFD